VWAKSEMISDKCEPCSQNVNY